MVVRVAFARRCFALNCLADIIRGFLSLLVCYPLRSLLVVEILAGSVWRLRGIVAALVVLSVGVVRAEPPAIAVSSFAMDTLTLTPPTAKDIVARLTGETWCVARAVESKGAWNELPAGVDRGEWISLVTVGFNGQAETYALMFDGPEGALSLAVHVPFRETWLAGGVKSWIYPLDGAVGALRVNFLERDQQQKKRLLKLTVVPWREGPDVPVTTKNAALDDAQTLAPELVFPPVAVMAHAAAFEAGWAPTSGDAPFEATCEVRVEDQACSFRLTLRDATGEHVVRKLHVPWETYHEHLVRLFRYVEKRTGVSDFVQLGRHPAEVLALHEDRLACLLNQELAVFNLSTGKRSWTTEPAVKPTNYSPVPQYDQLHRAGGQIELVRYRPALMQLDWETGKPTPFCTAGADSRFKFYASHSGEYGTVQGNAAALHRDGKQVWEQQEAAAITAGPLLRGTDFVYGQSTGRLVARSFTGGKVRWESQLPSSLYGQIVDSGGGLLVFSNSAEALLAIDPLTGQERWRTPVGDVLLQTPIAGAVSNLNRVLVATKGNRLLQLDVATGKVQQVVQWPTWLVSVTLIDTQPVSTLAVVDLAGDVTLMNPKDLKVIRTIKAGAPLAGPLLYGTDLPYQWPVPQAAETEENLLNEIKTGPLQRGPGFLAADGQGFLYILPLWSPE